MKTDRKLALVSFLSTTILITGCSDFLPSKDDAQNQRPEIVKKINYDVAPDVSAPVYEPAPKAIDYSSKPSNTDYSEEAHLKKMNEQLDNVEKQRVVNELLAKQPSWLTELHDKPVDYLKFDVPFNKKISNELLTDTMAYSKQEIAVLNHAFPSAYVKVTSVYDGDMLTLDSKITKESDIFKKNKAGAVTVQLMNIDCPELKQEGGKDAKSRLEDLLSIAKNVVKAEEGESIEPKLKVRYRKAINLESPLVILTLEFPKYEISVNRSLVYSGHCFTYTNYNQDRMLLNIEQYSKDQKRGLWAKRARLMAEEKWMMPWVFREKNS